MLELKRLSVDDGLDIYTMLQEIPAEENGLINKVIDKTIINIFCGFIYK